MAKQKRAVQAALVKPDQLRPLMIENVFDSPPSIPSRLSWSASALKTFRSCPRKFFWKYIMRLRPKRLSQPLAVGIVTHDAIGAWYGGRKKSMKAIADKRVAKLEAKLHETEALYSQEDYDKFTTAVSTLRGMLRGYARSYDPDRKKWNLKEGMVEVEFKVDLGTFTFQGKIDLLTPKKKAWILVEHKTASNVGDSYIDRLPMDTQIRAYIFGALKGLGIKVDHVLYDVIKKCKLRRKSNEDVEEFNERIELDYAANPGKYFYREPLNFDIDDINNFRFEMQQTHEACVRLIESAKDPLEPRFWTPFDSTCNDYFKLCEYHKLCTEGVCGGCEVFYHQGEKMHIELCDEEA